MPRKCARRKALTALNYDLFAGSPIPAALPDLPGGEFTVAPTIINQPLVGQLPSLEELYHCYDRYNWMYFDGRLPRVKLEYSGRMTSAGSYTPSQRLIRIGSKYHQLFPDEIGDTLKHEMIHLLHLKHDAAFKQEARRVGASIRAKSHPSLRRPARYIYFCPNCSKHYPRQKRLRMASCGYCSDGGKFDPRFKLRLLTEHK